MANQLFLVNQVAQAIEAEYPNVIIDTLAYLETIQVPKTARPRKNVAIRLCNDAVGAWSHPFTAAEQAMRPNWSAPGAPCTTGSTFGTTTSISVITWRRCQTWM